MRLIILGAPGSGKGTEARILARKLKLTYLASGDLFRKEYSKKTKLGLKAYSYWGKGDLVPDSLTISFLKKYLPSDNYLLDGYPRTLKQAKALEKKQTTDKVLYLYTTKKELVQRLLKRAKLEQRKDDTLSIILHRLKIYELETKPLLTFYKKKLIRIHSSGKPAVILQIILKKLRQL